jgi:hypothetical protein
MSKVTLTTELPIPSQTAAALARKPELMKYALGPVLRVYRMDVRIASASASAREVRSDAHPPPRARRGR